MYDIVQLPLNVDLQFSPQAEPIQSKDAEHVSEHGLDDSQFSTVLMPTFLGLGAFVVGDLTLERLSGLSGLAVVIVQPVPDLPDVLLQGLDLLDFLLAVAVAGGQTDLIFLLVFFHHEADSLIHLLGFPAQLFPGAAPFLRCIGRQLAAIDGEYLAPDQSHLVADHQHFPEQWGDLLAHRGYETGDGGEVRVRVGGQRHENDVLDAAALDLPAGGDAAGIGIQHNLQQNCRIVGRGTGLVVPVFRIEGSQIDFVVDQVAEGIFEAAGEDLTGKGDADEFALVVIVVLVPRHPASLFAVKRFRSIGATQLPLFYAIFDFSPASTILHSICRKKLTTFADRFALWRSLGRRPVSAIRA